MNQNDYTDVEVLTKAGESMNYRPVNINHNHNKWLPYPRTRLDFAKVEDYCLEGILRVDNKDEYIQRQLDHDPSIPKEQWIRHPSIEGRPNLDGEGYHFTGIALLEMGYTLPGDPLSEISPIIFEAMGETFCLLGDMDHICVDCDGEITMTEQVPDQCVCNDCGAAVPNPDGVHCPELTCPECGSKNVTARPRGAGGGRGQGGPQEEKPKTSDKDIDNKETGKREREEKEENTMSKEETGPLQRGGAVCPSCGHVVPETVTDVSVIDCPVCHKPMKAWSNLTYEQALTELPKMLDKDIELETEALKELFRPPFPETPNKMFTKTTGADLKDANIPSVGTVKGRRIGIVEYMQLRAEYEEERLEWTKTEEKLNNLVKELREENAKLQDSIATVSTLEAEISTLEAERTDSLDRITDLKIEVKQRDIKLEEKDKVIKQRDQTIAEQRNREEELEEELTRTKTRLEDAITQLHETSERSATSTQKAVDEQRERARIQEDNAILREKIAKLTREISNLTEKMSVDAKKLLKLEEERQRELRIKNGKIMGLESRLEESNSLIEKARKYQKWANKELSKAGVVSVQVKEEKEE
jgi:hypothetical protein